MLSDEWLQRYRLLENFTAKWNGNGNRNGNGNAYDRGDYNSSFALRAVELKSTTKLFVNAINIDVTFNLLMVLEKQIFLKIKYLCCTGNQSN